MEVLATASEGVMGALADKLKALLRREYDLQSGVRDDVRFLQSELPRMHAFLLDYARCQSSTALVKDWAREVQELAYDAEDAVDDFTHRVDVPAPVGIPAMVKHFLSTLMARRQIAEQLRDLRARALEVSERRKRYDLTVPFDAPSPTPELPPTSYAEMATNLVGVDGPRDEVIAKLMSDRTLTETEYASGRRVASMVGFAGVGKTTLAMSVYESLECQFQCGAFITVSRKFDDRKVLKDMLQQVIISSGGSSIPDPAMAGVETWEVRQLVGKLRDKLKDKRYLIVIDDLWDIQTWNYISDVLPENNLDSIIITTTRNESVANACCSRHDSGHFVHKVTSLNDLDSRTLFLRRIFGSEVNYPKALDELSLKILKRCAGLPLAIVCISSLLAATPPQETKWEKVQNSLGSEIESNDNLYKLKKALKVGYDDLPQHLKVCLLYLSAFPEDCKIEKNRLTRRWIAEGFIAAKPDMTVQGVAESYFCELIERGMIQALDVDCFGEVHACRIHDVMFEVIAMKSFEEHFVTIIGDRHGISTQQRNVRRLSIECGTATDGLDWSSFEPHTRSLTLYGSIDKLNSVPQCRFLRTLDFECCEGINNRHLKNIGELFLLKYLSLRSTLISELPSEIGDLRCLETLDLMQTNVKELPVEITRLRRLVHLLAGGAELPQGVGNMSSLQTLCITASSKKSHEAVKELVKLTNLRKLDMTYVHPKDKRNSRHTSPGTLPSMISKLGKCRLESLHLNLEGYSIGLFVPIQVSVSPAPDGFRSMRIRGEHGFWNVPMWIRSLSHLIDLELTVRVMDRQDLEILAGLPRLARLHFTMKESSRKGIIIPGSGFPCLKELFIRCRIMPVSFCLGVMPKLEKLELQFNAYQEDLKFLHRAIEHLQFLNSRDDLTEFQVTTVVKRGLSDREIQYLGNAFMSAGFI